MLDATGRLALEEEEEDEGGALDEGGRWAGVMKEVDARVEGLVEVADDKGVRRQEVVEGALDADDEDIAVDGARGVAPEDEGDKVGGCGGGWGKVDAEPVNEEEDDDDGRVCCVVARGVWDDDCAMLVARRLVLKGRPGPWDAAFATDRAPEAALDP